MINKKNFATFITAAVFLIVASFVPALVLPQNVSAASSSSCDKRFLGIPPWYRGLTNSDCSLKSPSDFAAGSKDAGIGRYVWTIALNIIEIVIVLIAYMAAFYIIYGGFQFIVGGSNPGSVEKARKTITNAIIGLIIAIASIGLVNYIFSIIK